MKMVDIFPWDENFNTGIELIDTQHYQLVSILNRLAKSMASESNRGALDAIFEELIEYTLYHFKTEESIWHKYLSDNSLEAEHQAVHQEFINAVLSLKSKQYTSSFDKLAEDTLAFLARWLASHILETDRYMAHVVRAVQEGLCLADAKVYAKEKMSEVTTLLIDMILSRYRALSSNTLHLIREIKTRQEKEEKLKLAASVFTHAREGILITDADNKIIEVNDTFSLITGYTYEEALGENPSFLSSGKHGSEFYAELWKTLIEKNYWSGEIKNRRKNGEEYVGMLTISRVLDETGKPKNYVALSSDITTMKEHQQQLEYIAHYDVLTDLPNRVLIAELLSQALLKCQRNNSVVAVAFIDIDGFKEINDTYGHNMGDNLLVELSTRMQNSLRNGDTLARIGGDEFLLVFVDLINSEDTKPMLNRLLKVVAKPMVIDNISMNVSASIGLSISLSDSSTDGDMLIRQADQAMYQAKQSGKNRYHMFDLEKDSAISIQRESLERIKKGMDNREFILYYQPKVNMIKGEVIGVEALIRWEHPEHGLLFPIKFLPIIENHLISIELGEWVIETALKQIETWQAVGLDIPISINISAFQLQQKNFTLRLEELLHAHTTVNPSLLELEILETSAIGDIVQVSTIMNKCLDLGVRFALDDFGTGYSSLTYLRRLPANLIKIDQTFVRDMLIDPDDLAIIEGIIGLAKAFGRDVIAEGVETVEHGKALLKIGCELAQGYGIAKPMKASAIQSWVKTWKPDTQWSEFIPNQKDFNVRVEVDHQHWINALQGYLNGEKDIPPPMDSDKCHFGHWLKGKGSEQYDQHLEFPVLVNIHERLHILGRELVDLYKQGNHKKAQLREIELLAIYSEQIKKIEEIVS
jgi:diguanylate cyclase (GGDEF)-like protein/hemerythrin-like metal-binding protein/PAS domain S-box-containing protein